MEIDEIAAYINDNYTGQTAPARRIARFAVRAVAAISREERQKIATLNWPLNPAAELAEEDQDAYCAAVRYAAALATNG